MEQETKERETIPVSMKEFERPTWTEMRQYRLGSPFRNMEGFIKSMWEFVQAHPEEWKAWLSPKRSQS